MSMSACSENAETGLTRIELAPTGAAHCFFCNTCIAQDSPRVVWHLFHAAGAFGRNNGANSGYTSGGWLDLYGHPQCCFHYRVLEMTKTARIPTCSVCDTDLLDDRRVVTVKAAGGKRCCKSASRPPLYHCFPCLREFLNTHSQYVRGYLSRQQRQEVIAWGACHISI
jgi:hypothetical protein